MKETIDNAVNLLERGVMTLVKSIVELLPQHEYIDSLERLVQDILHHAIDILPELTHVLLEAGDAVFGYKQLTKQLAIAIAIQASIMGFNGITSIATYILTFLSSRRFKITLIKSKMETANTYSEWKTYAEEYDHLMGLDKWRNIDESPLYDARVIKKRTADIRRMITKGSVFDLMFRLRGGLARDQYGMQHEGLFSRATAGTKLIVEDYHETVSEALQFIADSNDDEIPSDAKLAFFNETRHAYGRTALLLSGGAFLGYYHVGVVQELFRAGLLPRVISGASAGSLITAIIGTRTDDELEDLHEAKSFRKDFFCFGWQKQPASASKFQIQYLFPMGLRWVGELLFGVFVNNKQLLKMDTEHLKQVVIANTGLYTFQEAFDLTGRIINITVAPINNYDPPRLLNYLTAPHVCIWSAAVASCAIPGVFDSVSLIVKESNGEYRQEDEWTRQGPGTDHDMHGPITSFYSDGSIDNDLPMQQLSELFNVNHFIVSQVNPHSALLSTLSVDASVWSPWIYGYVVGVLRFLKSQLRDFVKNLVEMLVYRTIAPSWSAKRGISQILTQEYQGRDSDITMMPWRNHLSVVGAFLSIIKNPTEEEFQEVVRRSSRSAWPHITRVRAHCGVEMTLDRCVQQLRRKVASENTTSTKRDRTPSFYTSRSIVNLSGLSVSDPLAAVGSTPSVPEMPHVKSDSEMSEKKRGIIKTTSMSNFYYKNDA